MNNRECCYCGKVWDADAQGAPCKCSRQAAAVTVWCPMAGHKKALAVCTTCTDWQYCQAREDAEVRALVDEEKVAQVGRKKVVRR